MSIAVSWKTISVTVTSETITIVWVSIIRFGFSGPLAAKTLGASLGVRSGTSGVSSDSGSISVRVRVVTVITVEWFRFS